MTSRKPWLAALAVCFASLAGAAAAAEIRINNLDIGTGSGLDDHTAAAAVGGNPGKTRGEQARIVFEFAASLWGAVLKSRAQIVVDASFQSSGDSSLVVFRMRRESMSSMSSRPVPSRLVQS